CKLLAVLSCRRGCPLLASTSRFSSRSRTTYARLQPCGSGVKLKGVCSLNVGFPVSPTSTNDAEPPVRADRRQAALAGTLVASLLGGRSTEPFGLEGDAPNLERWSREDSNRREECITWSATSTLAASRGF